MNLPFEWLVAWRYLRNRDKPNLWVLTLGLVLTAVGGLLWALNFSLPKPHEAPELMLGGLHISQLVLYVSSALFVAGVLATVFGAALAFFNIFTTISIFGVFMGVTALIIVLSVMSGFEDDLKAKILGNNAHILIKGKEDELPQSAKIIKSLSTNATRAGARTGAGSSGKTAAKQGSNQDVKGLVAMAPYLQAEVILSGRKTHAGVYLKGIDPEAANKVSDLGKNIVEGVLDNLLYPERLRYLHTPPDDDEQGLPDPDRPSLELQPEPAPGPEGQAPRGIPSFPAPGDPGMPEPPPAPGPKPSTPAPKPDAGRRPAAAPKPPSGPPPRTEPSTPAKVAGVEGLGRPGPDATKAKTPEGEKPWTGRPPVSEFLPLRLLTESREVMPGIVVGRELARTLGIRLGYTVDVVSPESGGVGPMGPIPRIRTFRVAGVFFSGHYEFDTKYAYIHIRDAQNFLRKKGIVTGIEIRVKDTRKVKRIAARIREVLKGVVSGVEVKDWQQIHRNLFTALKLEKVVMFLVLAIIILVAGFSIGCNLIMVVLKKRAEVAALKSMGADNASIYRIFFLEGLYIGLIGMILGLLHGLGICFVLGQGGLKLDPEIYYISKLPVRVDALELVVICGACLVISFAATLYPAWQAAQLDPVEAFRAE